LSVRSPSPVGAIELILVGAIVLTPVGATSLTPVGATALGSGAAVPDILSNCGACRQSSPENQSRRQIFPFDDREFLEREAPDFPSAWRDTTRLEY
jgi:hypothetical protein